MERKFTLILFLVFLLVSVFLSLKLKSTKGELYHNRKTLATQNLDIIYKNSWYSELLFINISYNGKVASIPLSRTTNKSSLFPVVLLKNGFCSSCVKDVMPKLISRLSQSGEFIVVSHLNNRTIIDTMLSEGDISEKVIWHNDYLYGRYNIEYDAELLFIDQQNRIAGIIPLEYLKLEGLFDELLERFLAAE